MPVNFGFLTTLPLICFAVISILVPKLTRLFSSITLVIGGLLLIAAGVLLRLAPQYSWVIVGTLLLGSAIALLNVLIPVLVKVFFSQAYWFDDGALLHYVEFRGGNGTVYCGAYDECL
ncbi:MAG: hypothetical protein LRY63_10310 [Nitrincola sp.]|nr:hypothetical protein [Nitrincola sp.]